MDKIINIIVCDDISDIREYISEQINAQPDMQVVATASNSVEVIKKAIQYVPDVILMDIQLEYKNAGIEATKVICEKLPGIKIIMLTSYNSDELVVNSYLAGTIEYIEKSLDCSIVIAKIREISNNKQYFSPIIQNTVHSELSKYKSMEKSLLFFVNKFSLLTASEKKILQYLFNGTSRKQIAEEMYISLLTVQTHIRHILKKLEFPSVKELIVFLKDINFENFFK